MITSREVRSTRFLNMSRCDFQWIADATNVMLKIEKVQQVNANMEVVWVYLKKKEGLSSQTSMTMSDFHPFKPQIIKTIEAHHQRSLDCEAKNQSGAQQYQIKIRHPMLQIFRMPEGVSIGIGNDHEAKYFMKRSESEECPVARLELTHHNIMNFFGDQFAVAFRMAKDQIDDSFQSDPLRMLCNGAAQEANADYVYSGPRLQDNLELNEIYQLIGSEEQLESFVASCKMEDSELREKLPSVSLERCSLQDIDIMHLA